MAGPLRFDSRTAGVALAFVGFALLWAEPPWPAAIGLECVAAAFWLWARAAEDAEGQLRRWSWLRRPATAMWLAVAAGGIAAAIGPSPFGTRAVAASTLRHLESFGVVWAGLELLAALPVARPFADVAGPLLAMRPWLPAALPAAGFALLWRQRERWVHVGAAREVAIPLLLLTAWLGALRAASRRPWRSSLRWLLVSDSALAGVLVALDVVPPIASLLLWIAACGGRAYLIAGELRGAAPRRGPLLSRLWRLSMAVASAALAFPVLIALGIGPGGQARSLYYLAAAVPVALGAALTTRRHVEAPERRLVMRAHPPFTLGHGLALVTLVLGPLALLIAWWRGFEASLPAVLLAGIPVALGASVAMPGREVPLRGPALAFARGSFRFVVGRERWLMGLLVRIAQGLSAPLRDLHTGDPQEYLLFVIAVAVFALVIPLLR